MVLMLMVMMVFAAISEDVSNHIVWDVRNKYDVCHIENLQPGS